MNLEVIKNFCWDARFIIIWGVVGVAYVINNTKEVKEKILNSIVASKKMAEDGILKGGQEQENWVVNKVYEILPKKIKLILSEEVLKKMVKECYEKSLDLIDDGEINNSIKENK